MPQGLLGNLIIRFMNGYAHKELAEWAFTIFEIKDGSALLDVGCGGGGNISRLLKKYPNSVVNGIDYSPVSVAISRKVNKNEIENNRCQIIQGNIICLPYEAETFEVVTAFETIYYWPQIEYSFKQVLRVLKQNGTFIIVNGADAEGGWVWDKFIDGMHTYTPLELEIYLNKAGFVDIKCIRHHNKHYICVIAYKK